MHREDTTTHTNNVFQPLYDSKTLVISSRLGNRYLSPYLTTDFKCVLFEIVSVFKPMYVS